MRLARPSGYPWASLQAAAPAQKMPDPKAVRAGLGLSPSRETTRGRRDGGSARKPAFRWRRILSPEGPEARGGGVTGDTRTALLSALASEAEPGAAELCEGLGDVLRAPNGDGPVAVDRLRSRVYRLRLGSNGRSHSFMLRLYDPWLAWRNQLVVRPRLPPPGLGAP